MASEIPGVYVFSNDQIVHGTTIPAGKYKGWSSGHTLPHPEDGIKMRHWISDPGWAADIEVTALVASGKVFLA